VSHLKTGITSHFYETPVTLSTNVRDIPQTLWKKSRNTIFFCAYYTNHRDGKDVNGYRSKECGLAKEHRLILSAKDFCRQDQAKGQPARIAKGLFSG
jgi:hypothetical protein